MGEIRNDIALAMEPLDNALSTFGYSTRTLADAIKEGKPYPEVVPVLISWLPRLPENAKEGIVRSLSVPWARPMAAPVLIEEFKKASDEGLRWAIGNALEIVADRAVLEQMVGLAMNRRFGAARQMVVMALGKLNDARSEDAALQLLDDEQVAGHAIIALKRLHSMKALPALEAMKNHSKAWVRSEARKAIAAICKTQKTSMVM